MVLYGTTPSAAAAMLSIDFSHLPALRTERLALRELLPTDATALNHRAGCYRTVGTDLLRAKSQ